MNKVLLSLVTLFSIVVTLQAEDLDIPMSNLSGIALNINVKIENVGTDGAKYDRTTQSIINTSNGTIISISKVDFGSGRYGSYSYLYVEYTNPEEVTDDAFFDVYLDNGTTLVASIPVEKTLEGEYVKSSSTMQVCMNNQRNIYVKWRNHAADLKTFGAYERKPLVEVSAVKTGSPLVYKFSSATFDAIEGVHNLKMMWVKQSANVSAIYFDNTAYNSIEPETENPSYSIRTMNRVLFITSTEPLKQVEVYSIDGKLLFNSSQKGNSFEIPLQNLISILKITDSSGNKSIRRIICN
ncbi:MAG: hypothetical protein ACK5MK_11365 [Dysgonomonas sp.]